MAAPVTHIILADKVFDTYFPDKDKADYYRGTTFPDIRYLGVISRNTTHLGGLDLHTLTSLPAFEAGLKLHSLVDEVREQFMRSQDVYSLLPESTYITKALKFFEDILLYEKRTDWQELVAYFDHVADEEVSFGIARGDIERWHHTLQTYLATKPTDQSIRMFVTALNGSSAMAEEIIQLTKTMERNIRLKEIIFDFYNRGEELLVVSLS